MSRTSKSAELRKTLVALSLEKFATTLRADFRFAPLNVLLLVAIFVTGLVVHLAVHAFTVEAVVLCLGSALALAVLLRLSQVWEAVVVLGTADCLVTFLTLRPDSEVLLVTTAVETMGLGALGGLTAFGRDMPRGPGKDPQTAETPDDTSGKPAG